MNPARQRTLATNLKRILIITTALTAFYTIMEVHMNNYQRKGLNIVKLDTSKSLKFDCNQCIFILWDIGRQAQQMLV